VYEFILTLSKPELAVNLVDSSGKEKLEVINSLPLKLISEKNRHKLVLIWEEESPGELKL
jgi:hypothetical protein